MSHIHTVKQIICHPFVISSYSYARDCVHKVSVLHDIKLYDRYLPSIDTWSFFHFGRDCVGQAILYADIVDVMFIIWMMMLVIIIDNDNNYDVDHDDDHDDNHDADNKDGDHDDDGNEDD